MSLLASPGNYSFTLPKEPSDIPQTQAPSQSLGTIAQQRITAGIQEQATWTWIETTHVRPMAQNRWTLDLFLIQIFHGGKDRDRTLKIQGICYDFASDATNLITRLYPPLEVA